VCDVLRESSIQQVSAPIVSHLPAADVAEEDPSRAAPPVEVPRDMKQGDRDDLLKARTLIRANTAQRLTVSMLDKEMISQQQSIKVGQGQDSGPLAEPASRNSIGVKTAAQYADEMDEQAGAVKVSRWSVLRHRLSDVLHLKESVESLEAPAPETDHKGRSVSTRRTLGGVRSNKRMFTFTGLGTSVHEVVSPSSSARRVSDSTLASSVDAGGNEGGAESNTNEAKRDQAERDRLAAARERAREKALRAAQREERETGSMVDVLNTAKDVKTRRIYFAVWRLLRVRRADGGGFVGYSRLTFRSVHPSRRRNSSCSSLSSSASLSLRLWLSTITGLQRLPFQRHYGIHWSRRSRLQFRYLLLPV
jgi:hypothetical protein